MTWGELYATERASLLACAAIFGLVWGSFATVVIHRVPREESLLRPGPVCPHCGAKIRGIDLVPIVSFVVLRGRARCCKKPIPVRDLVVELACAALSVAIVVTLGRDLPIHTTIARGLVAYGAELSLAIALVCTAFIDAEYMFIPDTVTLGGAVLGVATATVRGDATFDALIGLACGFLMVWLPFVKAHAWLRGKPGMGLGDAKLTALAGAWFGWQGAVFALFAGALHGVAYAAIAKLFGIELALPPAVRAELDELRRAADAGDEEAKRELEEEPLADPLGAAKARVPFGPFLVMATLELLLAHDWLRAHAASWLLEP